MSGNKTREIPAKPRSWQRRALTTLLKLGVCGGLFYFLIVSGRLSTADFAGVLARKGYLIAGVAGIALVPVLVAFRWHMVLRVMGVRCSQRETMGLTFIGFLFNNIIPLGPSGGDVAKGVYLARRHPGTKLPVVISAIVSDRLLGMIAFNVQAVIALTWALATWDPPGRIRIIMWVGLGVYVGLTGAKVLILFGPVARWVLSRSWIGRTGRTGQIRLGVEAMHKLSRFPRVVAAALTISAFDHGLGVGSCWLFAKALGMDQVSFLINFSLVPVAMWANVIPGLPQGYGAFETALGALYGLFGATGGAAVALLWHLSRTAVGLLGIVPFLAMKLEPTAEPPAESTLAEAPAAWDNDASSVAEEG